MLLLFFSPRVRHPFCFYYALDFANVIFPKYKSPNEKMEIKQDARLCLLIRFSNLMGRFDLFDFFPLVSHYRFGAVLITQVLSLINIPPEMIFLASCCKCSRVACDDVAVVVVISFSPANFSVLWRRRTASRSDWRHRSCIHFLRALPLRIAYIESKSVRFCWWDLNRGLNMQLSG